MAQREPKRLPISSLDEMMGSDFEVKGTRPYITSDYGIIYGTNTYEAMRSLFTISQPYRVDDFRFLVFLMGDVEVTANLLKYHFTDNAIGFMGNGGIIQMDRVSEDVMVSGIVLKEEYMRIALGGRMPAALNGSIRNFYIQVSANECRMVDSMIGILRAVVEESDHSREAVASLIAAIVNQIASLYERYGTALPASQSRQQGVFDEFINLVNVHCKEHHTINFYADRLCITQRYLGTLVRQASGSTAKEWIDRALINEAKVALRHSDVTVAQLSDGLNFPNPAFFSKFFKRMTGMTPSQYQKQ